MTDPNTPPAPAPVCDDCRHIHSTSTGYRTCKARRACNLAGDLVQIAVRKNSPVCLAFHARVPQVVAP